MRALVLLLLLLSPAALYSDMSPEVVLAAGGAPAIAASRSRLLVVFQTSDQLRGVFADFDGKPIGEPFTIASDPGPCAVASDGRDFLVGWTANGEVRAAMVRESGAVESLPPIPGTAALEWGERLTAAFNGALYFLFWNDASAHAAVISTEGVIGRLLDFPDLKSIGGAVGDPSRLVAVGTSPMIVGRVVGVWAATVDASLNVSPAVLIAGEPFTAGSGRPIANWPAIAAGANGYFATWLRGRTSRLQKIESTRLTPELSTLDVFPSAAIGWTFGRDLNDNSQNWGDHYDSPRLAAAGREFVVVWALDSGGPAYGVWATFVDGSGAPVVTMPIATRAKYSFQFFAGLPDVVGFPDGHAVVVYARNPGQIVARSITDAPGPRRRPVRR